MGETRYSGSLRGDTTVPGGVDNVGTSPYVRHTREDQKGHLRRGEVVGVFSEMLDGSD